MSVRMGPGAITLTAIPLGANSTAITLLRSMSPALEVPYAERPVPPRWPEIEPILMMRPPPCSIMRRAAACAVRKVPVRLTRSTRSQSARVVSTNMRWKADAGVVDQDIDAPEGFGTRGDHALAVIGDAHVADEEVRAASCLADGPRRALGGLAVLVDQHHGGALASELGGDGAADAAARTCHERNLVLEPHGCLLALRSSCARANYRPGAAPPARAAPRSRSTP